jgi:hypothetical protein
MSSRRWLFVVVGFSAVLHIVGMIRTPLPAQDGLKFLRIARQFQSQPWEDAVRGSDQHPLYPALVALAEPVVGVFLGHGPDSWRIAAQGVSMLAALGLLVSLHSLTRQIFDDRTANLAVFLYALLPFPAAIGHDTLSDSLALSLMVTGLCLGERTLRTNSWRAAVGCGISVGLGFLTRPEVALVGPVVVVAAMVRWRSWAEEMAVFGRLLALSATILAFVGAYAFVKGEISEKLSLRWSTQLGLQNHAPRKPPVLLPKGLDDPRFDFSPKEESEQVSLKGETLEASKRLLFEWGDGLAIALVPVVLLGLVRSRWIEGSIDGRRILWIYFVAFALIAIRHASTLGYLSGRHALSLVVVSVPWASAGIWAWVSGFPARWSLSPTRARRLGYSGLAIVAIIGFTAQAKAGHPSRWGYRAAGLWLAERANPQDAVLDTRGWASFVRGIPGYDYWHVRQALSDRSLKYVVVGSDELKANSRRAATLRAMLAHAGKPVASFTGRRDGRGSGVEVYRFEPPESWEGITP